MRSTTPAVLSIVLLACLACSKDGNNSPAPADADVVPFAVDSYPTLVNRSPLTITGTKPADHSVWADGRKRLVATPETTWSLSLSLDRGDQSYSFTLQSAGADDVLGSPVSVTTLLDSVAPTVVTRIPEAAAVAVPTNTNIEALLDEPVDCTTVAAGGFIVTAGTTPVSAAVGCVNIATAASLRLVPATLLAASTLHTATLFADVTDVAGNPLKAPVSWTFTTGTAADTTPPAPPSIDNPAPPTAPTTLARVIVGGTKEAFASIEAQRTTATGIAEPWHELVAKTGDTAWSFRFDLEVGANTVELRSLDQANNASSVVSFVATRDPSSGTVAPPTLDPVVMQTSVGNQVVTGTKPADTSIWNGVVELAPLDGNSTWSALVELTVGANDFDVVAKDGADHASTPAPRQTIVYDASWGRVSGGSLGLTFGLSDLWAYIGDEFTVTPTVNDIDHFAVELWAEGPLTYTGTPPSLTIERCLYDANTKQRKHTRYAGTILRTAYKSCLDANPARACYGLWGDPDYRNPNYMAALIEAGLWMSAPYPLAIDADRRDGLGQMWLPGAPPGCDTHLWFYDGRICTPRLMQPPGIDGVTEATVNALYPSNGITLGEWSMTRTVTWDLRGADGDLLPKGPYLITLVVTVDRANDKARAGDFETCWDRPAHDVVGSHRVEGVVLLDGTTSYSGSWQEKGLPETVRPCVEPTGENAITCACSAGAPYPCPAVPNGQVGQAVRFFAGPVSVTYTP
jgi:hypothetical protein